MPPGVAGCFLEEGAAEDCREGQEEALEEGRGGHALRGASVWLAAAC